ncbi:DUF4307 domain-containing protein [Kineococcus sp. SYSU DK004]|uniref:DUF4307 domain-containing protein n=1 Tax=Kineococcus sp. SYSU DK004 TaxID=3383125 RepID=UPI003D7ECF91
MSGEDGTGRTGGTRAGTDADLLAERYGRRRPGARPWWRRPLPLAGAVLGALALLAWMAWAAVVQTRGPAATEVAHRVVDDSTAELRFAVTRDPGTAVTCAVSAANDRNTEVGLVEVQVPPGGGRTVELTTTVRTVERAVTVGVESCVAAD